MKTFSLFFLFVLLIFCLNSCFVYKSKVNEFDTYFVKGRLYHYNTLYIDSLGDTLVRGKLIIEPKDRPWIGQPRVQESVNYIHIIDSTNFIKNQTTQNHLKTKNKFSENENTGGYLNKNYFYIHPTRANQYRMLFYSAHPCMEYEALETPPEGVKNPVYTFHSNTKYFYLGELNSTYKVMPLIKSTLSSITDSIKVWKVEASSKIQFEDSTQQYYTGNLNSILDAEYCKEYTFIKLHHTFENGVKIQFDFEKMTTK